MKWPRCALVRLSVVGDLREGRDGLTEITVPAALIGGEYRAMRHAEFLTYEGMDHLLSFGTCGLEGRICLDLTSSAVVHVPSLSQKDINAVNASLDLFSRCVEAVIGRFPFDGDEEQIERLAADISAELSGIDPTTQVLNGFWGTFVDDLAMGNYSTEEVLDVEA